MKYLSIINKLGIGVTFLCFVYLMILFPSTINPQYGTVIAENLERYEDPQALEELSEEITTWVEASNLRSEFLMKAVLTFLLLMATVFCINIYFLRKLNEELLRRDDDRI